MSASSVPEDPYGNRAFYEAIGKAISQWAAIEFELACWLSVISGMPDLMANDVMFAPNSFKARLDIFTAALAASNASETKKKFAVAAYDKCKMYSTYRNTIVHGFPLHGWGQAGFATRIYQMSGRGSLHMGSEGVTTDEILQAAKNFGELANLMSEANVKRPFWTKRSGVEYKRRSPLKLAQLVEQLPNVAWKNEPSPNQRGRQRQLQAASGKPFPKKSESKGH